MPGFICYGGSGLRCGLHEEQSQPTEHEGRLAAGTLDLNKLEAIARAATPDSQTWIDSYGNDAALSAACDRETVLELIAAARAAPRWRTDAPPRGMRCLVTAPHPKHDGALYVFVATLSRDYDGHCWFGDGVRIHGVIAWMPAPAPASEVRP